MNRQTKRRTFLAVAVQLLIIAIIPMTPLWVRATGTVVHLETQKMDPRSLFRGHYVILGYPIAQRIVPNDMARAARSGHPVYVTVTTEYPGRFVAVSLEPPELRDGQACLVGRVRRFVQGGIRSNVDFPQVAQFFAMRDEARQLERERGKDLLAKVATSPDCNAQLIGLEPRNEAVLSTTTGR